MTVSQLKEALGLIPVGNGDETREITSCYIGDLLSWVMGRAKPGAVWITIMSNQNVAAVASLADVSCIILAENVQPDEEFTAKLGKIDAAVYTSPLGAYELACRIHEATGI